MEITKEPEFFVKNFAVKYILEFQKNLLKDIKSSELSYILYLKVKVDKSMGFSMDEISKQMNVSTEYIEQLEKLFDDINPQYYKDKEIIFEAIKSEPFYFPKLSKKIEVDSEIALFAVKQEASNYLFLDKEFKENKEVIENVLKNGNNLVLFDDKYRNNPEIVEIAIKNNPESIKYASKELQEQFKSENTKKTKKLENISLFENIDSKSEVKKKVIIPKKIKNNIKENER